MPQASDELRELMNKWFGSAISDSGPYCFLRARGFQDNGGLISPPVSAHNVSTYEHKCIEFLCDEWDYAYSDYS